ncbi:lipopolysaccharide biosynthesis protein [Sediminicola luteus]|uniref:Uncharacterized protein n=1 Tax=Sediminicola luteus TaxID=319238 RepID=A0A2A4G0U3_9FLAO|nr:lipopolysaccharide biosynthesis protein [Sediminicola luteus]PCE62609.1 hypothetical protein B7P33_18425 [Sediminicola luteus]
MSIKLLSYVWNSIEKFGSQIVRFILGILLARILDPNDYGLIGLLVVFTSVAQIFIDSGFSKALIQRNDKNPKEIGTAFSFNLIVAIGFYALLFVSAPLIANYYEQHILTSLLRVLALTLVLNALFTIPNTILSIELNFKKIAIINFVSIVISGMIAIVAALNGYGVWSLVIQYISKSFICLVLFALANTWKPQLIFDKDSFKRLFSFGYSITLSSLLNQIISKFSWLFIAKSFSASELGYYNRGIQFPDTAIGTLGTVLDSVLLPNLARVKEPQALKNEIELVLKYLSIITVPITVVLIALAEPIIHFLLTEKWSKAIPILQIFCISRFFTNFSAVGINSLYAMGKANLVLKQQYIKMIVRVIFILVALKHGIVYLAIAETISVIINFAIGTYYPNKLLNLGFIRHLKIMLPYILMGAIEFLMLYFTIKLITSDLINLLIVPIIGIAIHVLLMYLYKKEEIFKLKKIINRKQS